MDQKEVDIVRTTRTVRVRPANPLLRRALHTSYQALALMVPRLTRLRAETANESALVGARDLATTTSS